jgi:hypothetical protein
MSATTTPESPPGSEKEEARQPAITARPDKTQLTNNYSNDITQSAHLQAGGSSLPQLASQLVRAVNQTQLLHFASMQSMTKNAVVIFWLDAICSSYSLLREREKRGPKASPIFPLPLSRLFAEANKKRRGGGKPLSPASCALAPQAGRGTPPFSFKKVSRAGI